MVNSLVYTYTDSIEGPVPLGTLATIQNIPNAQVIRPSIGPGTISGTLYVPNANCSNAVSGGLHLNQLPHDIHLIAIIPSLSCAQNYFQQAQEDDAWAAIIFDYDGSSQPPTTFNQPIYGISITDTNTLRNNLGSYSGNITDVTHEISSPAIYDSNDLVTLQLTITTPEPSSTPWVMIIGIVAGVVVALFVGFVVGCVLGCKRRTKKKAGSPMIVTQTSFMKP